MPGLDPESAEGSGQAVNLLLPEGLSPERYHALAQKLVETLRADTKAAAAIRAAPSGKPYVTLSELGDAPPPENVPVLNDWIWVLTVPVPAEISLQAIRAAVGRVPKEKDMQEDVQIELVPRYGIPEGEQP